MQDKVVVGSLGGIIGAFVFGILDVILNATGIASIRLLLLDSEAFLPAKLAETTSGYIFGFFVHLSLGAIMGVFFIYVVPYIGYDYLLYKGILLGGGAWLVLDGLIGNMLDLPTKDTLLDNILFLLSNFVFGIVTVYSIKWLASLGLREKDTK